MEVHQMSDEGEIIIATFSQARRFCEQVGLMIQTTDSVMDKLGWDSCSSQAVSHSSAVNKADEWLPYFACRYFENKERPGLLPFLGVLFDYDDDDAKVQMIPEPLVTAGWYDYGRDGKREAYIYWHAVIHVYIPGWKADGSWAEGKPTEVIPKAIGKFSSLRCRSFARPVLSLKNTEDLTRLVIDPLIADIGARTD
jgi:hypothetical protein